MIAGDLSALDNSALDNSVIVPAAIGGGGFGGLKMSLLISRNRYFDRGTNFKRCQAIERGLQLELHAASRIFVPDILPERALISTIPARSPSFTTSDFN